MDLITVFVFGLVGAAAQFVDGLLGMGFGVTSATLLSVLGYSAVAASAGTHAAKIGTTLVSGASHWREGNVDWRTFVVVGVPGAIGSFIGAVVLTQIALDGARFAMALILLILGVLIVVRFGLGRDLLPAIRVRTRHLWPVGLFGGIVDATGGGGWGPVATPSLLTMTRQQPHRVVGTVSASEFVVAAAASLGFLVGAGHSEVPWLAVLGLVAGGAITAPIAARLARRARTGVLGVFVGGMIIVSNIAVISAVLGVPGVLAATACLGVAAVVTALAINTRRRQDQDQTPDQPKKSGKVRSRTSSS